MTDSTFPSVRSAAAYALSHRKGPQPARPSVGSDPRGYRSQWDGSAVRACMVLAGIEPDSSDERQVDNWARRGGPKPVQLERALRKILDEHGLLAHEKEHLRNRVVVQEWQDPETGALVSTRSVEE